VALVPLERHKNLKPPAVFYDSNTLHSKQNYRATPELLIRDRRSSYSPQWREPRPFGGVINVPGHRTLVSIQGSPCPTEGNLAVVGSARPRALLRYDRPSIAPLAHQHRCAPFTHASEGKPREIHTLPVCAACNVLANHRQLLAQCK
jgi:hypothetical protein